MEDKPKLYVFDFDGTLTSRDSLLAFIRYTHGSLAFYAGFTLFLPLLVLMKLHLLSNGKVKEWLLGCYYKGVHVYKMRHNAAAFAASHRHILRPQAVDCLDKACRERSRILIVTASDPLWVAPFLDEWKTKAEDAGTRLTVVGTEMEVKDGRMTGRFATPNCYGAEKVRRIEAVIPHREHYRVLAFGDSRGDKEMLEYADEKFEKPFR